MYKCNFCTVEKRNFQKRTNRPMSTAMPSVEFEMSTRFRPTCPRVQVNKTWVCSIGDVRENGHHSTSTRTGISFSSAKRLKRVGLTAARFLPVAFPCGGTFFRRNCIITNRFACVCVCARARQICISSAFKRIFIAIMSYIKYGKVFTVTNDGRETRRYIRRQVSYGTVFVSIRFTCIFFPPVFSFFYSVFLFHHRRKQLFKFISSLVVINTYEIYARTPKSDEIMCVNGGERGIMQTTYGSKTE